MKARHLGYTLTVNLAPVLLWMIVIFILSTDSFSSAATTPLIAPFLLHPFAGLSYIHIETISLVIRKLGHGSEYFILGVLLMRALNARSAGVLAKRHIMWSLTLAVIYALTDEWHQSFVPSRTASIPDVIIDAIAAVCGALSWYLRNRRGLATALGVAR
ncbi:MAG TPA: VanZ family protein [Candidatus Binatia bacterium]|nr:VanZ family protein [Candidatus Binatia bacterium]